MLFALLVIGCSKGDSPEYSVVNIEAVYPFSLEKYAISALKEDSIGLFKQQLLLINSIDQLKRSVLFLHCPDGLKENLSKCDFGKYSLIMTSSTCLNEVTSLKFGFLRSNLNSNEYHCNLYLNAEDLIEPVEYIYLTINIFSVYKIPDDSKILFSQSVLKK